MKQTLKEVLGSSYDYYFPKTEQDRVDLDATPSILRTRPDRPCLACGGCGPHNPAPGCHDFL